MPFAATWMDLETLKLSEISQKEKDKYYDITYIWNLIYSTDEPFHRKETHGLGEQTCGCQGGRGGSGVDWELGVNRCIMLPSGWISNGILAVSPWELCLVTYIGTCNVRKKNVYMYL